MGSFSSKQKKVTTSKSDATVTPTAPKWLEDPTKMFAGTIQGLAGQTPTPHGPAPLQQTAFNAAGGLNSSGVNEGLAATRPLTNWVPQQVQAGTLTAPSAYRPQTVQAPNAYRPGTLSASSINAPAAYRPDQVAAGSATAGQLKDTDLAPYINPWTGEVETNALNALEQSRQKSITQGQGAATQAGAYGGSRHGVADAETNKAAAIAAGDLSANLRREGFQNAQTAALADIGNKYNADTFNLTAAQQAALANQGANLTAGLQGNADQLRANEFNANAGQQAGMFNLTNEQQAGLQANADALQAALFNSAQAQQAGLQGNADQMEAGRFNIGTALQALLANQNADAQGAQTRLSAAEQLGRLGLAGSANDRANIETQAGLGETQREIDVQNDPQNARMQQLLQLISALGGLNGANFTGRNISETGSGTETTTGSPSLLDNISQILKIGAAVMPTPKGG